MATIRSRLQSQLAKKQNRRKGKGKGKKRYRHSSDGEDSDSDSEEDTSDSLLSFLTTATRHERSRKERGKRERLGMTVIVGSSSCSDRNSHASDLDAVPISSSPRGGFGGMTVSHPTVYHSRLETPTVDSKLEVSALENVLMSRSLRGGSGDDMSESHPTVYNSELDSPTASTLLGLAERNASAAREAATKGTRDGGSVRVMAELHSKGVAGWDTDASRAVTTNAQYMIPSLLDRSRTATQSISFSSAAGTNSVLGIGPKARATIDTEDGKAYWVIEPDAVLMDTGPGGNSMSVYSAQSMKRLGLALQQCYKNTERDVIVCRKTGRVVNLSEENGILVLRTVRRQATDLSRMPGIEDLVNDIREGLISPLVPCSLKQYRSKNSNSNGTQLTLHAQFKNRGRGSEEDLN